MSKIVWDKVGEKYFETGVSKAVLYPTKKDNGYTEGVGWSGITSIKQAPSGGESTPVYADNVKYLNLSSNVDHNGTIEAIMYPNEYGKCIGEVEIVDGVSSGQQKPSEFGLSYTTILGNDELERDYGHKIHLVYNALAKVSEKTYSTINDNTETGTFSWEYTTTPVPINTLVNGRKLRPTALLTIDATKVDSTKLKAFEDILYGKDPTTPDGDDGVVARLPLPDEVIELLGISAD